MRFRHQLAHAQQVAFFQRLCGFNGTRIFRDHVANAFGDNRIQFVGDSVEGFKADITQRWLLEETRAGFALFATGVVFATDQCAFKVTVDDHHRYALRHGNGFGAQGSAVDQ